MLVRFHGKTGSFTMQGDVATALLRLMGMSGEVPGALLAKDAPQALERLRRSVPKEKTADQALADEAEARNQVGLATRAFPLIQLLESAVKRDCDVIWEELKSSTG